MSLARRRSLSALLAFCLASLSSWALTPRQEPSRWDGKALADTQAALGIVALDTRTLAASDPLRRGWEQFIAQSGGGWAIQLDQRSGLPTLAAGRGLPWVAGVGNSLPANGEITVDRLAALANEFLEKHTFLLGSWKGQLVLDRAASGALNERVWQVVFRQVVDGVPVDGARYDFQIVQGNLVSFGAYRWNQVRTGSKPNLDAAAARQAVQQYLDLADPAIVEWRELPQLLFKPIDPRGGAAATSAWSGERGAGLTHQLIWRLGLKVPGEAASWVAEIDAQSGAIVSFQDVTRYDQVKGGVYPLSNDGLDADGQEKPNFPMPFADIAIDGTAGPAAGDQGIYSCNGSSAIRTTLVGPYIRNVDNCGAASQTAVCGDDIDLGVSTGTDCVVPAGSSAGNTHSARSSFYHLNRVMQKGRAWLPNNNWLRNQVTNNININATCNATWDDFGNAVNFYKSGGGCRNTGELQGVFVHEWGHGIDFNDGGGYDVPTEAYADIVAVFEARLSCVGRGFYQNQQCSGYGDTCLNCTGIRDQDWDKRQAHTPATPQGFATNNCGGGGGPCGKEQHCEAYVSAEAIFDLATRDLPASGVGVDSAWQLAERLWFQSRTGSGGNAYNCSLPSSDGCGTNSWFHKFRVADDDDGNLNNGTPHAAAIFAAFNRHRIACGAATDASNQSNSSCPTIAAPVVSVVAGSGSTTVNWGAVPGASRYRILRNDLGCTYAQIIIGEVNAPGTSYVDSELPNGFTLYYRVQAIGSNAACESPVSSCEATAAQPFAGAVSFENDTYGCNNLLKIRLTDANVGAPTVQVSVWSDTEPTPETVTLTEISSGASKYLGSILSSSGPAIAGDGKISFVHGNTVHVRYIDANNGSGGINVPVEDTTLGDCVFPVITNVRDTNTSDVAATIAWTTDENSDSVVDWGPVKPPANTASASTLTTNHQVPLSNLQGCTIYYYNVRSTDPAGNVALATNGGNSFYFETLGDFGQGLQPCHQGRLTATPETLSCTQTLSLRLVDLDLNLSNVAIDTTTVRVSSTTEFNGEPVVLTETGPNTSTFTGSIALSPGAPTPGNGRVEARHGDLITASYGDANDGAGNQRISFDTSLADCNGAEFNPVRVTDITDDGAVIRWTTSEPTTGRVEWGSSPALGSTVVDGSLGTTHALTIGPLLECGRYHFRVFATDAFGNQSSIDAQGQPFAFNSGIIPGIYRDNFDAASGWTLQGEWQIGAPSGKGSSPPDPTSAFTGSNVLGHDLTGLGAHPGDYERSANERAISPVINASGKTRLQLWYRRWLNVGGGGISYVEVKQGTSTFQTVWNSDSVAGVSESSWGLQKVDISQYADNNATLQLAFRQFGGPSAAGNRSGWNVDRFVVHSLNDPDFVACGGCGGAPTFAGATAAIDNNACSNNGVTVNWTEAPGWGTGGSGTYAVFRDTAPNFTPSASNRIARGVAATNYNDTTAPDGATLYYIVRAENNETCSNGPNNGGVTDSNTVTRSAATTSSQPIPGQVSGLLVTRVGGANVHLAWSTAANAPRYRVLRGLAPQPGSFAALAEVTSTTADDVGAAADKSNYYYLVRGLNRCNQEGP